MNEEPDALGKTMQLSNETLQRTGSDVKKGNSLNWSMIWRHASLLLLTQIIFGVIIGVVVRQLIQAKLDMPTWILIPTVLTLWGVILLITVHLGYVQYQRTFIHVMLLASLTILSVILSTVPPIFDWWTRGMTQILPPRPPSFVPLLLRLSLIILTLQTISASIGLDLRARRQIAQIKIPTARTSRTLEQTSPNSHTSATGG